MKKKNKCKNGAKDFFWYAVCLIFAILNLVSLKTGISFLSYLSAIPFIFLIIEVFSRIMK